MIEEKEIQSPFEISDRQIHLAIDPMFIDNLLRAKAAQDITDWKEKTGQDIRLQRIQGNLFYEPVPVTTVESSS